MSKKSRARAELRRAEKPVADCLESQKQHIRHAAVESLIHTVSYGALTAVFVVGWMLRLEISIYYIIAIIAIPALLTIGYGVRTLHICRISRLLTRIHYATDERVSFHCRKARFLARNLGKWNTILFCIIFYAEDGRVFTYVYGYPEGLAPEAASILRQRLNGVDVTLTCYKDTSVVKIFNP